MTDEAAVSTLYRQVLDAWNRQSASEYAALFTDDANVVGFDGSQMNGRADIESTIGAIFRDHRTASYIGIIRSVRLLSPDVALLCAVSGLVPPDGNDINPATNAVQSLVAQRQGGQWRIALFQNTPAQFHGRPEAAEALTDELRAAFKSRM
jgi:uncharacterized protein (TIGR02246 family)